jgi:hypothetical protein
MVQRIKKPRNTLLNFPGLKLMSIFRKKFKKGQKSNVEMVKNRRCDTCGRTFADGFFENGFLRRELLRMVLLRTGLLRIYSS